MFKKMYGLGAAALALINSGLVKMAPDYHTRMRRVSLYDPHKPDRKHRDGRHERTAGGRITPDQLARMEEHRAALMGKRASRFMRSLEKGRRRIPRHIADAMRQGGLKVPAGGGRSLLS